MSIRWPLCGSGADLAIDLGTANTLLFLRGRGIILDEPSVVAFTRGERKVVAVGRSARRMAGRTAENLDVVRPLQGGVVVDIGATVAMLRSFLQEVMGKHVRLNRVLISVPREVTPVERRAFREVCQRMGAAEVRLIDEPLAAAIGAQLPVCAARGCLLVDVGSGITEAAVIALGEIVHCQSIRQGGQSMDEEIMGYVRDRYGLLIGEAMAEATKIRLLGNGADDQESWVEVRGRWLHSGLPGVQRLVGAEVLDTLEYRAEVLAENVLEVLNRTPPELVTDICDSGISLTGGSALVRLLSRRVGSKTGLPVHLVPDPLGAVALGNGRVLSRPWNSTRVQLWD